MIKTTLLRPISQNQKLQRQHFFVALNLPIPPTFFLPTYPTFFPCSVAKPHLTTALSLLLGTVSNPRLIVPHYGRLIQLISTCHPPVKVTLCIGEHKSDIQIVSSIWAAGTVPFIYDLLVYIIRKIKGPQWWILLFGKIVSIKICLSFTRTVHDSFDLVLARYWTMITFCSSYENWTQCFIYWSHFIWKQCVQ